MNGTLEGRVCEYVHTSPERIGQDTRYYSSKGLNLFHRVDWEKFVSYGKDSLLVASYTQRIEEGKKAPSERTVLVVPGKVLRQNYRKSNIGLYITEVIQIPETEREKIAAHLRECGFRGDVQFWGDLR